MFVQVIYCSMQGDVTFSLYYKHGWRCFVQKLCVYSLYMCLFELRWKLYYFSLYFFISACIFLPAYTYLFIIIGLADVLLCMYSFVLYFIILYTLLKCIVSCILFYFAFHLLGWESSFVLCFWKNELVLHIKLYRPIVLACILVFVVYNC